MEPAAEWCRLFTVTLCPNEVDTLHFLQVIPLYIGSNNPTFQAHLHMSLNFHLNFVKKVTVVVVARNLNVLFQFYSLISFLIFLAAVFTCTL
jgi:hypothetical protein